MDRRQDKAVYPIGGFEKKYDAQFKQVFEAIRQFMALPEPKRRPIGFRKGDG